VTRICSIIDKPALIPWAVNNTLEVCKGAIAPGSEYGETYLEAVWDAAKKESQRRKSEAAIKGTEIHREIETLLRDESGSDNPRREHFAPLCNFLAKYKIEHAERKLYSRRYRYSGTTDAVALDGRGLLVLLDWKTGKSIYPEFRLQTAAYVHAYEEEFPDQKIAGRYIVRIAEDGSIEPHFYPRQTLRLDFAAFLGAKALFDRVQTIEKENRKKKAVSPLV
jgi:PD-(D/E)XK nuclease superfamily